MSKIDKYKAGPGKIQERIPPGKMAFSTKDRFLEMREYNDFFTNKFEIDELSNRPSNRTATKSKAHLPLATAG